MREMEAKELERQLRSETSAKYKAKEQLDQSAKAHAELTWQMNQLVEARVVQEQQQQQQQLQLQQQQQQLQQQLQQQAEVAAEAAAKAAQPPSERPVCTTKRTLRLHGWQISSAALSLTKQKPRQNKVGG